MGKVKLDTMTEEQLQDYKKQLEHEIDTLTKVIEASNTTVFDLLINEVKEEMRANIAEEEWKKLKENQKKVESYRSIEKTLQNQEDLLDRKQEELEDVEDKLKYYQQKLFAEQQEEQEPDKPEYTGFSIGENGITIEIKTGDIFVIPSDSEGVQDGLILIKKSVEIEGSYAMISNYFDGERCLQYPANFKVLDEASCIGNIYDEDCGDYVLDCLRIIGEHQVPEQNEDTAEPEDVPEADAEAEEQPAEAS